MQAALWTFMYRQMINQSVPTFLLYIHKKQTIHNCVFASIHCVGRAIKLENIHTYVAYVLRNTILSAY